MGGTFPAAVKFLIIKNIIKSSSISLTYGINTLGACIGTIAFPPVFLPYINQNLLLFIAATINLLIFLGTFTVSDIEKTKSKKMDSVNGDIRKFNLLPIILFTTRFVSISLETIWNRIFSLYFTNSVYNFSLILFVFLIFVALGSIFLNSNKLKYINSANIFAFTQVDSAILIIL